MNYEKLINFNKYFVNKDGSIISKYWNKELKNRKTTGKDYIANMLTLKNGKKRWFFRHRVVWYYFNGEIPEGCEIDHIDTNPSNNSLQNLRLVTHKENMNNPITKEKLRQANIGSKNPRYGVKLTEEEKHKISEEIAKKWEKGDIDLSKAVMQYTLGGELVKEWKSATDCAKKTEFRQSGIQYACNGGYFDKKRGKWHSVKQYKGYIWKYKTIV